MPFFRALNQIAPHNQVRLHVHSIWVDEPQDFVGLLLECEWPDESEGLVLQNAVALDSVNGHLRAVVSLDECSMFCAESRGYDVNLVTSTG